MLLDFGKDTITLIGFNKSIQAPSWVIELIRDNHDKGDSQQTIQFRPIHFLGGLTVDSKGFMNIGNVQYKAGTVTTNLIYQELLNILVSVIPAESKRFHFDGFSVEFLKNGYTYISDSEHKMILGVTLPTWVSRQIIADNKNFPSLKFAPFTLETSCKWLVFAIADTGMVSLGGIEFDLGQSVVSRLFLSSNHTN